MRHYYRERQALLKCISALFRLSLTDQANAAVDEARQRLDDPKNKLDRRMLDLFVTLSDEPVPKQRLVPSTVPRLLSRAPAQAFVTFANLVPFVHRNQGRIKRPGQRTI
jgi:hypothetical protein